MVEVKYEGLIVESRSTSGVSGWVDNLVVVIQPNVFVDGADGDVCSSLGRCGHSGAETALATAVQSKRINELLEVIEPVANCIANAASAVVALATAGESKGIIGSFQPSESVFPSLNSSCLGSLSSACARRVSRSPATASARVCPGSSFLAVSAAVVHTHASILHGACYNS